MRNNNITVWIEDFGFTSPFYKFYLDENKENELQDLVISNSYTFKRIANNTIHPFYISDQGRNQESSNAITISGDGTYNSGITDIDQEFTITFNDNFNSSEIQYYCTNHSTMKGIILVIEKEENIYVDFNNNNYAFYKDEDKNFHH